MHSPTAATGPSVTMRRPAYYNHCLDPGPPPAAAPSTKILHSLLYNFAHSGYLSNGTNSNSQNDESSNRNREQARQQEMPERIQESPSNHLSPDHSRHRRPRHDMPSPQRQLPYRQNHLAPYDSSSQMSSRCFQNPSATVTSQTSRARDAPASYSDNYLSPRHRSSSIGSAGSSFRDSRSPSHDSTTSHDSLSRCSPLSLGSSPSPSPPTPENNSSKLFGILKGGTYSYPYGILPNRNSQEAPINHRRTSTTSEKSSSSYRDNLPGQKQKGISNHKYGFNNTHTDRTSFYGVRKRDISETQDEPIDLSCKNKKVCVEPRGFSRTDSPQVLPRSLSWTSDYYSSSCVDRSETPEANETPKKSILESILCGKLAIARDRTDSPCPSVCGSTRDSQSPFMNFRSSIKKEPLDQPSSPLVPNSPMPQPESPVSAVSTPMSLPPSPAVSMGSQFALTSPKPRCPWRQQVTLAKKNLFPVSARVSDWLLKIVEFAKSRPEFASLPDNDKVTLVQSCWTRLMLLYMAENNFHFAVTPIHEDADDGRPPAISGIDPTEPTMDSVELVQNFIRKCQNLNLEVEEYQCLRLVTLFHSGCTGLENADFVDKISSGARQKLQDHVRQSRPDDKLRYSNLLLCLHTLFGVNCGMVQTLFCKHLFKDKDIDEEVKGLVLRRDEVEEEDGEDNVVREDAEYDSCDMGEVDLKSHPQE